MPRNPMWIVAWTINHGRNNLVDHWLTVEDKAAATREIQKLIRTESNLHCYAAAPITIGSEPHYTDQN